MVTKSYPCIKVTREEVKVEAKILVALDSSHYAQKVMLKAIELAKLYKTPILALSVINDTLFAGIEESSSYAMEVKNAVLKATENVLNKCMDLALENGIEYRLEIRNGNPAEEIIECAEQKRIEIIVLGHLGHSAVVGFSIGSVAQKVSAYSKCSVFIVK